MSKTCYCYFASASALHGTESTFAKRANFANEPNGKRISADSKSRNAKSSRCRCRPSWCNQCKYNARHDV